MEYTSQSHAISWLISRLKSEHLRLCGCMQTNATLYRPAEPDAASPMTSRAKKLTGAIGSGLSWDCGRGSIANSYYRASQSSKCKPRRRYSVGLPGNCSNNGVVDFYY